MTDDDRCVHDLAPGTCSYCSGREATVKKVPHISECSACGEPITWVYSEKGKRLAIDVLAGGDPKKARFRKQRTEVEGEEIRGIVHFVRDDELPTNLAPLYCCHWDSCLARGKKT